MKWMDILLTNAKFRVENLTSSQIDYIISHIVEHDEYYKSIVDSKKTIYLKRIIESWHFKDRFAGYFMDLNPDKIRNIFIHIPKTGGTSINEIYKCMPSTAFLLSPAQVGIISNDEWYRYLFEISDMYILNKYKSFYVLGHCKMRDYIKYKYLNNESNIFTVLRNPADICISQLNFIADILIGERFMDEKSNKSDYKWDNKKFWLDGLSLNDDDLREISLDELAEKIVFNFITPNIMCDFIGFESNAFSAYEVINRYSINTIMIKYLDKFILQNGWSVKRENVSRKIYKIDSLRKDLTDYIFDICTEDRKLIELISP